MTIAQQGTARQLYIAKPTGLLNSFRLKSGLTDVQLATHFAHTYLDRFLSAATKELTTENNSTDKTEF